jgi:ABC-type sulfate transport system substrate-binding protein
MNPTDSKSPLRQRPNGLRRARIIVSIIIVVACSLIFWFGKGMVSAPDARTLTVYCYTGMQEVMEDAIFPAFQDYWKERHGERLAYIPTFAGSGTITTKIVAEFPAEIAIFSSNLDAIQLASRGVYFVRNSNDLPFNGVINRTPIVMLVGKGNPKGVHDFGDLVKVGVDIAYPDPHTSGAGQLGILAIFGSLIFSDKDELKAYEELHGIWKNVVEQPANVRDELKAFLSGVGDVLITYESNILKSPRRAQIPGELIYPKTTIFSEPVVRAIKRNVKSEQMDLVDEFIEFLWSIETQQKFVDYGFRSIREELKLAREDFGEVIHPLDLGAFGSPFEIRTIIDNVISPQ